MQENFIPHYVLKARLGLEERQDAKVSQDTEAPRQDDESSVIMASFDTFHMPPEEQSRRSDKEQDYQAGYAAGKAEASAVYESTIKVMETTLEALKTGFNAQVSDIEESHGRVILKCLEAVLPQLSEHILISELKNVLLETSGQNLTGGVTIRLHPNNHIAKKFLSEQGTETLRVIEDKNQTDTNVSVAWDNSRTEIDPVGAAKHCLSLMGGQYVEVGSMTKVVGNDNG